MGFCAGNGREPWLGNPPFLGITHVDARFQALEDAV